MNMIEINLLPKGYRKSSFSLEMGKSAIITMAGFVGIILMLVGITSYQSHQISELDKNIEKTRQRATMLQKDIKIVDALTDVKAKINSRMRAVDRLDSHRSSWVRILEDFASNVPEFVWLFKFEEESLNKVQKKTRGRKKTDEEQVVIHAGSSQTPNVRAIRIEGYSFTLNSLATFMINIMRSDYFDEVELISSEERFLDNEKEHKAYNFVLTSNLHYLSEEQLRSLIAGIDESSNPKSKKNNHKVLN